MNRALFLDRDGTLIKDAHYLKDPKKGRNYSVCWPGCKKAKRQDISFHAY